MKVSKLTLQKAQTLASINGTAVNHQLQLLARRTARLSTRPTYTGSVKRAEGFYLV